MSFFFSELKRSGTPEKKLPKHIPIKLMNEMRCSVCDLDKAPIRTPKMQPEGNGEDSVYVLGTSPTIEEDSRGKVFSSKSARFMESMIPRDMTDVRFNNIVRCHTAKESTAQVECCRQHIVEDIEETKPRIIVGMGSAPLNWATGLSNVNNWRGRMIAVRIGNHTCWYYPVFDPEYVLQQDRGFGKSEFEKTLAYDWQNIQQLLTTAPKPKVYTGDYDAGVEIITGHNGRQDLNKLEDFLNWAVQQPSVGLDIETIGLRPYANTSKIITCSIGTFDRSAAFSVDHPDGWAGEGMRKKVWGMLIDYLLQSHKKVAHNLQFELEWFCYFIDKKIAYTTEWADTLLLAHTLDERKGTLSLDDQCRQNFGFYLKQQSNVDPAFIMEYALPDVLRYNAMDSKWTHLLEATLSPMVMADKKYQYEYERKLRLAPALVMAQMKGVSVDKEYAEQINKELDAELHRIEEDISNCPEVTRYKGRFGAFSPASSKHVITLMKDVCHRSEVYVDDNKTTSNEDALTKIPADEVPSAPLILEHRAVSKLRSTYVLPVIENKIVCDDHLIHTQYNSTVAETGRLSSEDPNMQNFPKRKHKKIRGMIVPVSGGYFLPFDYGQLEARVIAWASEDESLVRALWTGYDIHGYWADRIMQAYGPVFDRIIAEYHIDINNDDVNKKVRKSFRDEVKNGWVFPQFFGSATRSCANTLKIPDDIAEDLGEEFWAEFKGVKRWQERVLKTYDRKLYVETMNGRKRRGALSKNQIINHPIQGSAADFVEDAMCEMTEYALDTGKDIFQPVLNIHDDLTFDFPMMRGGEYDKQAFDEIVRIMCRHRFSYVNVPVVVEAAIGRNWYETKEIAVYRSDELFNLRNPYA